jgi:hypothetical protein
MVSGEKADTIAPVVAIQNGMVGLQSDNVTTPALWSGSTSKALRNALKYIDTEAYSHFLLASRDGDSGLNESLSFIGHNNNNSNVITQNLNETFRTGYNTAGQYNNNGMPFTNDISLHSYGFSFIFDDARVFNDGSLSQNISPGTNTWNAPTVWNGLGLLGNHNDQDVSADYTIFLYLFFTGKLSDAEQKALNENPWQIFQPLTKVLNTFVAAADTSGAIPRRIPRTKQPPPGTPLDLSNPLTRGLVAVTVGNSQKELIANADAAQTGSPSFTGTSFGLAHKNDLSNHSKWTSDGGWKELDTAPGATILALIRPTDLAGSDAWGGVFGCEPGFHMIRSDSTNQLRADINSNNMTLASGSLPEDEWTVAVSRFNSVGPAFDLWSFDINGSERDSANSSTGSIAQSATWLHTTARLTLKIIADFGIGLVWERALSDAEIQAVVSNPWQIFQPHIMLLPVGTVVAAADTSGAIPRRIPRTGYSPDMKLDKGHPLYKYIRHCFMIQPDQGVDLITGLITGNFATTDDAPRTANRYGLSTNSTAAGGSLVFPTDNTKTPLNAGVLVIQERDSVGLGNLPSWDWGNYGQLARSFSTNDVRFQALNSTITYTDPGYIQHTGVAHTFAGWLDTPNIRKMYLSGNEIISATDALGSGGVSSIFTIQARTGSRTNCVVVFDDITDLSFGRDLTVNPWQLFQPHIMMLPVVAAAASSSVSITDVNTTESWTDGDTGLIATGTGFV